MSDRGEATGLSHTSVGSRLVPEWMRGYQRSWATRDIVAGVTLAAVAIPETMGYTSIARTPIVTGLYTVLLPTVAFALLGSSKLLVVGADSATAAVLAAGLAGLGVAGLTPDSSEWLAWCSLTALVVGAMLVLARLLRLGFIADFLSASVLIGFLTGVGIQVLSGQIPTMLGLPKGSGNWFEQQWYWITHLSSASWATFGYAAGTLIVIVGFKRFLPRVPGAVVAVIGSIVVATATSVTTHGVSVVGSVTGGFPPLGLPSGVSWSDLVKVASIAFSCLVLILAQSAATSRSFGMRHGDAVNINRDIVGLSVSNLAAGLSGTFVVNGSPTKTQILDEQKGRTQLANLAMSAVVLVFVLFATGLLTNMPNAVLAAIVFLIGVDLIDVKGLRLIQRRRMDEFVIALVTGVVVFAWGVEQGIVLAIVLSLLELIRRQYRPADFVVTVAGDSDLQYVKATPGAQSQPGLLMFRYDAELFYANGTRFVDNLESLVTHAPDPVRWVIIDAGSVTDIDYSAGIALGGLLDFAQARGITFALARADDQLVRTLGTYQLLDRIGRDRLYDNLLDARQAFLDESPTPTGTPDVDR